MSGVDSLNHPLLLPCVLFILPPLHEVEAFVSHLFLLPIAFVFVVPDVVIPHARTQCSLGIDEILVNFH